MYCARIPGYNHSRHKCLYSILLGSLLVRIYLHNLSHYATLPHFSNGSMDDAASSGLKPFGEYGIAPLLVLWVSSTSMTSGATVLE